MSCGDFKWLFSGDAVDDVGATDLFLSGAELPATGCDVLVRVKRDRVWTPGLGAIVLLVVRCVVEN